MPTRALRIVILLTLLFNVVASALEVDEHRWSFDGKTVPGRFNLLSILVSERGPKAFDGEISLVETRGGGSTVGAPMVQKIYVTPGTSRWVQFVPFVVGDYEWSVRWGKGEKASIVLDPPGMGAPATVLLIDTGSVGGSETRLRAFPADLFPTSVAATDALDQVAIDHSPRWDAPRREAFMDWVRRGGVVHLIRGPSGHPAFEGELAPLNTTLPRERMGSGMIVRHDVTRADCSASFLKDAGFPPREKADANTQTSHVYWGFDQGILKGLAALTKPKVAWWLLYLLTIAYLVIIGPVHYKWSRSVDYRIAIGGFLGTVAVFAIAFIIAGRRGSGETQTVHSVALARSLSAGRWDTMQWISAFATSGDYYHFTHASPTSYYSASNDMEAVNGKIYGGKEGHFDVDIPLYSSRPFFHRGVLSGPDWSVQLIESEPSRIVLQPGVSFPQGPTEIWIRRGDRMIQMRKDGDLLKADFNTSTGVNEFFNQGSRNQYQYDWNNRGLKPEEAFRPVLANYLSDIDGVQHRFTMRPLAKDQLQLYVYDKAPPSFSMKGEGFDGESGWVLYVQDLFK
jgi:hypothetical protein